MKSLILLTLTLTLSSCASTRVKLTQLQEKNLVGYWTSTSGIQFNYMDIKCNGDFNFISYDYEDKNVHIAEIHEHSFTTSPQLLSHYYQVIEWPTAKNKETIRLKYIPNSFMQKMSSSLNKLNSEKSKKIYSLRKSKTYKCHN